MESPEVNPAVQEEINDLYVKIEEAESEIALHEDALQQYQEGMTESLNYPPDFTLPKYTKEEIAWIKKLRKNCTSARAVYAMPPSDDGLDMTRPLLAGGFNEGIKIGELRDLIKKLRERIEELLR